MMSRDYKCYKCGKEFMELYENSDVAQNTAVCECGNKAKRIYGCQFHIDDWSPTGTNDNQAHRDIEHFDKKRITNGKYVSKKTEYVEDKMKTPVYEQAKLEGKI